MNYCVNHPDAAVTAWCQNCGKGLCSACVRTVQGNIYCEPCAAFRASGAPPTAGAVPPGFVPPPPQAPNPGTAAVLGFIPGVGAMYNGQYIKAIVHVLVFVVLVGMSDRYGFFGFLIAFWVLYQVFDAHQTARARRDGLPLPDPFGLNELGNRIGGHPPIVPPPVPPSGPAVGTPSPGAPGTQADPYSAWAEQVRRQAHVWGQEAGQWGEQLRQRIVTEASRAGQPPQPGTPPAWGPGPVASGFTSATPPPGAYPPPPGWGPVPPVPPAPPAPPVPPEFELERARREPIGAIVLILLGMLFLFNTLGFFSFGWVNHGWPWIIVAIAVWLLVSRGGGARFGFHTHVGHPPAEVPPTPSQTPQNPAGGAQ